MQPVDVSYPVSTSSPLSKGVEGGPSWACNSGVLGGFWCEWNICFMRKGLGNLVSLAGEKEAEE